MTVAQEQIAEWLYDGAVALQNGNREQAQEILLRVVEADEANAEAWLWLSGAVEDPEDQITALENTLEIEPNNVAAQRGLAWLKANKK